MTLATSIATGAAVEGLVFTVGSDPACSHATLGAAIQAAGPAGDVIRLARNHTDLQISVEIVEHSVVLEGGFDTCADAVPNGRTVLDGSGGAATTVIRILGGVEGIQEVVLRDLSIVGGEGELGGGIEISGSVEVRLESVEVADNNSTLGGGVFLGDGGILALTAGSSIRSNLATGDGGGLHCTGGGLVDIQASVVELNESDEDGGGVYLAGCHLRVTDGGAIVANEARFGGGGLRAGSGSLVELTGNSDQPVRVSNNRARGGWGGGVWLAGRSTEMIAHNAVIESNLGVMFGGGIAVTDAAHLRMERTLGADCHTADRCSRLSDNIALGTDVSGGGALFVFDASAEIYQTYLENNATGVFGSAVYTEGSAALTLEGVVIAGSHGYPDGFGRWDILQLFGASATLAFATITDNPAHGFVISTDGDLALDLRSSVIWETDDPEVFSPSGGAILIDCLIVHDDDGLPVGEHVTVQDPLWADPGAGDYHLSSSSPAVDYCDGLAGRRDIDHGNRGLDDPSVPDQFPDSLFDVGADELGSPPMASIYADGFESGDVSSWSAATP